MSKKLLIGIIACTVAAVMTLSAVLIFRHKHTYATEWSSDATHHWHVATCEHTDKKSGYAEHAFVDANDIDCDVCGYVRETDGYNIWDGTATSLPSVQNGVITIKTAEQFAGFANAVNGGNSFDGQIIKLGADIDLAGKTWTPIGLGSRGDLVSAKMFSGIFDGDNHVIYGLTNNGYVPAEEILSVEGEYKQSVVKTYNYGLFGMVSGATIKNVKLEKVAIDCDADTLKGDSVGALIGFSTGALNVTACEVSGFVKGGYDSIGGVIGRIYNTSSTAQATVTYCVNKANVTGAFKSAGVVGYVASSTLYCTVSHCENTGDITATGAGYTRASEAKSVSFVSGVVNYGWNGTNNTMIITYNTNRGNIISTPVATNNIYHGLAFIANTTYNSLKPAYQYDFTGNQNIVDAANGKGYAYDLGEITDVVYLVVSEQVPFSARAEVNNTTNISG